MGGELTIGVGYNFQNVLVLTISFLLLNFIDINVFFLMILHCFVSVVFQNLISYDFERHLLL